MTKEVIPTPMKLNDILIDDNEFRYAIDMIYESLSSMWGLNEEMISGSYNESMKMMVQKRESESNPNT